MIDRYRRAANPDVVGRSCRGKWKLVDPGFAEKTGSRIVCFGAPDFCPYWVGVRRRPSGLTRHRYLGDAQIADVRANYAASFASIIWRR